MAEQYNPSAFLEKATSSENHYLSWLSQTQTMVENNQLTHWERNKEIARVLQDKEREAKRFMKDSYTDPLTGMLNRRAFDEVFLLLQNTNTSFGMLFVDLDGLKHINDTYGHPAGDNVILDVSSLLKNGIRNDRRRQPDIATRIAGDEFVVFFPDVASEEQLQKIGTRINRLVENSFTSQPHTTVSIGGGIYRGEGEKEFKHLIDQQIYMAKSTGKNKTNILPCKKK